MNDIDRASGQHVEPYIGMPIYLDDCDDIMDDISGDNNMMDPGNTMPGNTDSGSNSIAACVDNLPLAMAYVP